MNVTNVAAGAPAPDVEFELISGNVVSPADFKGQKLVIFFCHDSEPFSCSRQLHSFADLAADFEHSGTWIIGLIGDPSKAPESFMLSSPPIVPLAVDPKGLAKAAFGLRTEDGDTDHPRPEPDRATFLIDRDGTVDRIWRSTNHAGHAREVLEAARELT